MSLRSFNPDGGDMGFPEPYDDTLSFPEHVTRAGRLLTLVKALSDSTGLKHRFCYSFMLPLDINEGKMNDLLRAATLPSDVIWYTVDGKKLFEMRGPSGGIASSKVCYLITNQ